MNTFSTGRETEHTKQTNSYTCSDTECRRFSLSIWGHNFIVSSFLTCVLMHRSSHCHCSEMKPFFFLFCQWGKDDGVAPADFFWITSTIGQQANLSSRGRADFTLTFLNYSDWKWKMYVFVLNVHCSFKHSTCFVSLSCSWMHKSEIMPILIHINGYIAQSNSTLNNYSVFISAAI